MKKIMTIFGAVLFASFILSSCGGNSIESDAKKYAELMCKSQKLASKAAAGSLAQEMEGKYKDAADYQKFTDAYLKAMGDCK